MAFVLLSNAHTVVSNNKNTQSSIACLRYMSRHALQTGVLLYSLESKMCVLSSFLKRVRSAMSQSVEGKAFHASGSE